MRGNRAKIVQRSARAADELMLDVQNGFRDHRQITFEKQIVNADDGAGERVFDGGEKSVRCAFGDSREGRIKRRAGEGGNGFAQELNRGGFAESAGFALECDPSGTKLGRQRIAPKRERRRLKPTLQETTQGGSSRAGAFCSLRLQANVHSAFPFASENEVLAALLSQRETGV